MEDAWRTATARATICDVRGVDYSYQILSALTTLDSTTLFTATSSGKRHADTPGHG